jgi:hypothetical protein
LQWWMRPQIVVDEVVGMWISLLVINPTVPIEIVMAFLLFRYFDWDKPWPISVVQRRMLTPLWGDVGRCVGGGADHCIPGGLYPAGSCLFRIISPPPCWRMLTKWFRVTPPWLAVGGGGIDYRRPYRGGADRSGRRLSGVGHGVVVYGAGAKTGPAGHS